MLAFVLITFLILLLSGLPIVVAMGIPSLIYMWVEGLSATTMSYSIYQALNSFPLLASPLFILMGCLINQFDETENMFRFTKCALRKTKGYTAKTNIMLSLLFAGMSGAAIADIGGLGQIEIKAMEDEGFDRDYSAALTAATSMVGPLFPPSIPLVIFAVCAQVSSLKALMAGAIPAILITVVMYIFVHFQVRNKPLREKTQAELEADKEESLWEATKKAAHMLILVPAIIISMLTGVFSPSEAGAAACLYLLIIETLRGKFSWKILKNAIIEATRETAGIFIIIAVAAFFTKVLTLERFPEMISNWFLSFSDKPVLIILLVNLMILVVGCFMETVSSLTILTPILLGITTAIGMDPLQLGVILVFNLTIGMLTPPFGVGLFTVAHIAKQPMEKVLKQMLPMFVPLLIALLLISFVPFFTTWLPSLL